MVTLLQVAIMWSCNAGANNHRRYHAQETTMTSHPTTSLRLHTSKRHILMTVASLSLAVAALMVLTLHTRGEPAGAVGAGARGMAITTPVTDQDMYDRRAATLTHPEPVSDREMHGRLAALTARAAAEPEAVSDQEMYCRQSVPAASEDEAP
jgi:hypothetical protein